MLKTAEFVSPKHPDKICDYIADSLLDAFLQNDPKSRVALEVMGGHKLLVVNGEVTSAAVVDIERVVNGIVGDDFKVISNIVQQNPEIARGVDTGGAGDQGIMVGYACAETESLMPKEYELARNLCRKIYEVYPNDGKTQVTVEDGRVTTVVASFQNAPHDKLLELAKSILPAEEYLINPAGDWSVGGFDSDTGVSGRKIVIDSYGPSVPAGGGSFSGKDYTKVDRSGAYMARRIAVDYLKKHDAKEVFVKLAYAIGKPLPVMAVVVVEGQEEAIVGYDLSPKGIREYLHLDKVSFATTSPWGHFGNGFPWD
ncbi:MAG: hypothetical protein A3A80_04255 [Candidatus Terrybacteria bacterium RIFCSPLOWO2_01_FULL_44_24]|uniref:methionine adenosyltransferase n=1 Tax=Candidatus Terrybacteria bacterium RIFCSPHIGHO2_01_FULL_43_35 TaxID=1802361 RepID=A0A1G2PDP7_9BACT|nr:MAG: hypothetical protein A2828_01130 [Candidatus Terrybacteria bacterium RIFCSPHIGHO2_01_FULL_43_35]OHA51848.1 MAG: hypothetical protein A3A80_04255 [Candidatus Terrybacteria bacterium RIFCSPLOWO2_01_FULL_44_24]